MTDPLPRFDAEALYAALDAQRSERELTWPGAAREIWELSRVLNSGRADHPISPATITGIQDRGDTSCQHALFFLRWLGRTPESFLIGTLRSEAVALPDAGPDRRLRWHLHARPRRPQPGLSEAMDERRTAAGLTWAQLADELSATPSQVSGLQRARFAIGIGLAMTITQWLERPAADFVYAARW